jgi:hypothetical protein
MQIEVCYEEHWVSLSSKLENHLLLARLLWLLSSRAKNDTNSGRRKDLRSNDDILNQRALLLRSRGQVEPIKFDCSPARHLIFGTHSGERNQKRIARCDQSPFDELMLLLAKAC